MSEEQATLPTGWVWTTLGEIGVYHNGRGFKKSEWRETGRPIIRIQNLTNPDVPFNCFDGEADERHEVEPGDLLVSWAATIDVFKWDGPPAVLNQHIFKVQSHIDPDFHYLLLKEALEALYAQAHGSGMVHITKKRFDSTPVALPPLAEQQRIVRRLEELQAEVAVGMRELNRVAEEIKRLEHSVRVRATDGHANVELGSVISDIRYGTSVRCTVDADGPPVLRIPNVRKGEIDTTDLKFATKPASELGDCVAKAGDLLFVRTNGSRDLIGRVAVIDIDTEFAFASYLIRARPTERLDPHWAAMALSTPALRADLENRAASTAGQYNLNIQSLRSLHIPLPPIDEQRTLVQKVREQVAAISVFADDIQLATIDTSTLDRALLRRALQGELLPQSERDESALLLLEAIGEQAAPKVKERKSRGVRRATTP